MLITVDMGEKITYDAISLNFKVSRWNYINTHQKQLNYFLVQVFNDILRIEEDALRTGEFENLSVREMHVIEAVCYANEKSTQNRSADIAGALSISAGTLTTAVTLLEKKGCLIREKDAHDKRIVRLFPTEKGKRANALHQEFHRQMVANVMEALSDEEIDILIKGLISLESFFLAQKKQGGNETWQSES